MRQMITDRYTDDWQRTNPDFVVYLPETGNGSDGYADHFFVFQPDGASGTSGLLVYGPQTFRARPEHTGCVAGR